MCVVGLLNIYENVLLTLCLDIINEKNYFDLKLSLWKAGFRDSR